MQFSEELAIVMVMLCDFTIRKFQRRIPNTRKQVLIAELASSNFASSNKNQHVVGVDDPVPFLNELEDALYRYRTKLSAAHARSRIRARVLSIESLLPSNVRQNEELASRMHICSWVNFCKTRLSTDLLTSVKSMAIQIV